MSIISQTINIVNSSTSVVIPKYSDKKAESVLVAQKLYAAGLKKRGDRIMSCNRMIKLAQCADCGHIEIVSASYCRDRLCPLCSWRLSIQRYARMRRILESIPSGFEYSLVTLTVKNCKSSDLSSTIAAMSASWADVRRQRWLKDRLIGWARSLEVTYNKRSCEVHPHFHIIAVWSRASEGGCTALIQEWLQRCARHGLTCTAAAQDAQSIKSAGGEGASLIGAICETMKYCVKSKDLLDGVPLSIVRDIAIGLEGKKLISLGGLIKKIAAKLAIDDIDKPDDDESGCTTICTTCGGTHLDELIAVWSLRSNSYIALCDASESVTDELLRKYKEYSTND